MGTSVNTRHLGHLFFFNTISKRDLTPAFRCQTQFNCKIKNKNKIIKNKSKIKFHIIILKSFSYLNFGRILFGWNIDNIKGKYFIQFYNLISFL